MRADNLTKINEYAYYYGRPRSLHTICFVHGLIGHPLKTWGDLPFLVQTDPDLPEVDILMFGYKSRLFLHGVHNLVKLGVHLTSCLSVQLVSGRVVNLVGHSMGGLVILQALISQMRSGRALMHPCNAVEFVSLVASPVNGKTVLKIVERTFFIRHLLNKHLRALAAGKTADDLIELTKNHIYEPATDDKNNREIPIRMIMASRDKAVDKADKDSIRATFDKIEVLEWDYGHGSIKKPESHAEDRYKAIVNDLKDTLAAQFQAVCKQCCDADPAVRSIGKGEFVRCYEPVVRRYFKPSWRTPNKDRDDYRQFVTAVWKHAAQYGFPVHFAARQVMYEIRAKGMLG